MSNEGAGGEITQKMKAAALTLRCPSCAAEAGAVCVDLATRAFKYELHGSRLFAAGFQPQQAQPAPGNTP